MENKRLPVLVWVILGVAIGGVASGLAFLMVRNNAQRQGDTTQAAAARSTVDAEPGQLAPSSQTGGAAQAPAKTDAPAGTGVFVNQKELTDEQLNSLREAYGAAPPKGRYWYDSRSGLYGYWGYEAAGYIRPGHDFGALPADASNGKTGVSINGREINVTEAAFFQRLFGVVYRGHFWLDGATGNMGVDGNPIPLANLVAAMQRARTPAGGDGYTWRDGSGATVGSEGNCTFAAIPGAPVYSTPGCN